MNIYDIKDFNKIFDVINKNFSFSFNNLLFSRLSIGKNFENLIKLLIIFVFDKLN